MELEEMKQLWQEQQAATVQSNEQLIRRLIDQRTHRSIDRMLVAEYGQMAICVLSLFVLLVGTDRLTFSTEICITYPLCLLTLLFSIVWGLYKVSMFRKIDIAANPLLQSREQISKVSLLFFKELRWGMIAFPFLLVIFLPVIFMMVRGTSVMPYASFYLAKLSIGLVVGWASVWFIYRKIYHPVFRRMLRDLEETRSFTQ